LGGSSGPSADLYGGVCVNVLRHPAWGRAQETYGEDPFHVGEFGAALVRGVQRHAMACVKHFACNSMENARFKVDVTVDEVALHEVFLPQFRRIVDEGVAAVMSAYNSVNGEWCGQDPVLLTDVLRHEWDFEGFVISDWIFGLRDGPKSVAAGLNVEMPYRMIRSHTLPDALARGDLSWDDIDRAVIATIATLLRFEHLLAGPRPDLSVLASIEHRGLAREAAAKSVVLLRNEPVDGAPVLPLQPGALHRVAVIGRLAGIRNLGDGGSSDVWAPEAVTPLQGLRAALGGVEVSFDDGSDPERSVVAAGAADVAVVVVGYTKADEGEFIGDGEATGPPRDLLPGPDDPDLAASFIASVEASPGSDPPDDIASDGSPAFAAGGDRSSLRLHQADEDLIALVSNANRRTVVAVVAGSAVIISPWAASVPAIVQSWYAGMEGGHSLADVLLGVRNAEGRLPFSVPTDEAHLPEFQREAESVTYDRWHGWWKLERDGHQPHFPFGFGLSYTCFEWDRFALALSDGAITISGAVTNTGERAGAEVVQAYAGPADGSPDVAAPRHLVGFSRLELGPGETASVTLSIPRRRLSRRDPSTHRWELPSGRHVLEVGRWVGDPEAQSIAFEL
jgi:beta-glucosidase